MPDIGVLSDTHNFLDERIHALFQGVAHILHAGDVGAPGLIRQLESIAPVTFVGGNTDDLGFQYPLVAEVQLAGKTFLLQHILNPHNPGDPFLARINRLRPAAVVFGHTHKPLAETVRGTLFFNPGYSGRSRFGLARSVAIFHCGPAGIKPEFLPL